MDNSKKTTSKELGDVVTDSVTPNLTSPPFAFFAPVRALISV
jgi:hypothetical protein